MIQWGQEWGEEWAINSEQDSGHLLALKWGHESAERTLLAQVRGVETGAEMDERLGVK
jgi:hypothetical protein